MDVVKRPIARALMASAMVAALSSAGAARGATDTLFVPTGSQPMVAGIDPSVASARPPFLHGQGAPIKTSVGRTNTAHWPWDSLVAEASRRFDIPETWLRDVMQIESGGRAMLGGRPITSSAGAMGLMQLMPATFADMTRRYGLGGDPYEPRANILAGAAFLRELYDRYGPVHFLAAYNAGPGRVDDHLRTGRALPLETQRYVQRLSPLVNGDSTGVTTTSPPLVVDPAQIERVRRATRSSSRSISNTSARPRTESLFALVNGASTTSGQRTDEPPGNALFVHRKEIDLRRGDAANTGLEN